MEDAAQEKNTMNETSKGLPSPISTSGIDGIIKFSIINTLL
jgi:hypothetical protein